MPAVKKMQDTLLKINNNKNEGTDTYLNLVNNLLLKVQKPGQYLGIEWGHLVENVTARRRVGVSAREQENVSEYRRIGETAKKRWSDAKVKTALIYPDLYELGMANFGTKILYQIINSHSDYLCDRAYAPMQDMEALLRKENISLWGWESFKPLNDFDLLGFSLSYELSYTNVLNILELSKLEVLSAERKDIFPLVFAGGPAAFNPEPMADFIDFFIIGDGEEVIIEILDLIKSVGAYQRVCPNVGADCMSIQSKQDLLLKLAQIPGVYVPKFYNPDPNENYLPKPIDLSLRVPHASLGAGSGEAIPIDSPEKDRDCFVTPLLAMTIPEKITKRVVNLSDRNQPTSGPIPYLASVQDRQVMEIRRGCDRGCRFCQPGYVYLPVRERTPDELIKLSTEALKNTGYDEYSLLSLSASDYTRLHEAAVSLNAAHSKKGISLSMPSQRADRFNMEIANELNTVRKSGITLAPEAGTERLREVINKGLKEKDIKRAIESVYDGSFRHVKLYFMIGLPTETTADLDGIINLLKWANDLSRIKNKKPLDITCTISTFVPKAFTPFQWFSQNKTSEFEQKIIYLKQKIREYKLRTVKLNCTDPKIALLEAVMSRGDRRISELIYSAFKKGAKFDAWDECLDISLWKEAGKEINLDLDFEATKHREIGSINSWDIIDTGLLNKFLIEEMKKALSVTETSPCTENTCHACGVCFELGVLNLVTEDKSKNNKFVKEIDLGDETAKRRVGESANGRMGESASGRNGEPAYRRTGVSAKPKISLPTKSVQKIEIIHTKSADLRFISHLDVSRLFERAMRRAGIPFSFTEGFNPRPKMQWLLPLPIYYESDCELLHLELADYVEDPDLQIRLNQQLPPEFQLISAKTVDFNQKLGDVNNIKFLYRILTYKPEIWEKYICELRSLIESFLAQKFLILKVLKNNKDNKNKSEKQLDIRSQVEGIKITNELPLELELILSGSTRAEMVLDQIIPKGLKANDFQKNWQIDWKIKKENIIQI